MSSRRQQACEACRARKLRCLPGSTTDTCKRCESSRTTCVPHRPIKRRAPSRRRGGYRFVDKVIDSPGSALPEEHQQNVLATDKLDSTNPAEPRIPAGVDDPSVRTFGQILLEQLHIEHYQSREWAAFEAMTHERCLTILGHYSKRLVPAVPFALILPDWPLEDLVFKWHPVLLLAMIVAGSSCYLDLQRQADTIFRTVLADRVIVKGERSLELFQALLTCLAWYQHRFDPRTQQFYQLLQLAIAMAADLGLAKSFASTAENHKDNGDMHPIQSLDELNEIRAFSLAYYLNCGAAVLGYDRPENMHCIRSLRNAADILARSSFMPLPLDIEGPGIIELMHIAAQHRASLNALENEEILQPCDCHAATALKLWESKYLRASTPCVVKSSYHFISTYLLLKPLGGHHQAPSPTDIVSCLDLFQAQLRNILDQGPVYLVMFGLIEWAPILTYLYLLPRLEVSAVVSAPVGLTAEDRTPCTTRMISRFRAQLDRLRAEALIDPTLNAYNFFSWLERIFSAIEQNALALQAPHPLHVPHATVNGGDSAYDILDPFHHPDGRRSSQQQRQATPNMDSVWVDFMSDWLQW
ncbi:hypothetical protein HRR83_000129 [Exophiala dermatitidis]|uniref:Zn(2)-C6 fungal-type domain-containing protein n=2 Tax=Exophiala dermatitidis TaxID=5970 RepID=H6C8E2_EXODN|nr:uncharacterized protein HMPREF1120_08335 [Exophiala dermatitidis NIH/UT8656]KAJ4523483.1 hypothetical protein HRR73_002665 [Exophiala dermatitidis]EHY60370.1 hypothetical protein HMPREF1120_08335 [Exophiala dermatitidis NIH/UT8656]KAJ4527377.1 hypothetical protein HRR74_000130 [Exophiala dermatitidis]KAJ4530938.1 hypothetical protein HRR76_008627 [Exophiala dermatitidis]KAJ4558109.1 hypothetical protein HRR77_000131 [Exophiala dermatitidis]